MLTSILCAAVFIIPRRLQAQTLQWDDVGHSTFSLTVDHNLSESIVLNQITYDSNTYEFADPILINTTGSLPTTIQAFMSFEEPIDDIKQAADTFTDYRAKQYDYQTITRAKAASLLALIHNGTLEYDTSFTAEHLYTDGTLQEVDMKNYPTTASCPGSCQNPDENGFAPTYGGSASCYTDCIVYLCEYGGVNWGAGSCDPLGVDDNVTAIESQHEAWWAVIRGDTISYRIRLAWGYGDPQSANTVYNNRWGLQYLTEEGNDIDKTCDSAAVYWDNGHYNGELYKPTAAYGNEYRKVSYSLKNISVSSQPSVVITIGSYSDTQSTPNGNTIKQAISDKFSYQRVIIDDIGYRNYSATDLMSNSSMWLFINETYFGFECDEIMVDQLTWEAASCGDCLNRVLSTWSTADYGITTVPYYSDLDSSNGIDEAVKVVTNVTKFAENDIGIHFNYLFPKANVTISSTNFAFKQPNVCNGTSTVQALSSTKLANVSFTNCGEISADFTFTINCANSYTSTTFSSVTVAANAVKSAWTLDVTNSNCDIVSSVTISMSSCPEFWNITCSWPTTMTTLTLDPTPVPSVSPTLAPTSFPTTSPVTSSPTLTPTVSPATSSPSLTPTISPATLSSPTLSPLLVSPTTSPETSLPSLSPTLQPSDIPTLSPTLNPSTSPSLAPTAAPVSFFASCTSYQVVPVRGAVGNTIIHQELCISSTEGHYIVDINANKPYCIVVDSATGSNTTINRINTDDYDTGIDSNTAATGAALIGHSIIPIETWYDVLAYLGLDVTTYTSSQSVITSIKVDGLSISTDIATASSQDAFSATLEEQIVSELGIDDNQIDVHNLRSGSIIADIEISSTASNTKSALEINVDLQNYISSNVASSPSITSPLNSVNNYFYANQMNHIVFTNCPYRITATTWEGETTTVSWDEPSIQSNVNANDIAVYQAIGESSGESFAAGSYFVRYVALSASNMSIKPKYCSFAIVVEEQEWILEFMGVEFSVTVLIIIATILFCLCTASIIYSAKRRQCCTKKRPEQRVQIKSDDEGIRSQEPDNNFKSVIVSSYNAPDDALLYGETHDAPNNALLNEEEPAKLIIKSTSS